MHKGKVEAVAHIINQIKVYNSEFEDLNELEEIVKRFNERINSQVHQGTHLIPKQVFDLKERSTLNYVNLELLRGYIANTTIKRTVSKAEHYKQALSNSLPNANDIDAICEHNLKMFDKL